MMEKYDDVWCFAHNCPRGDAMKPRVLGIRAVNRRLGIETRLAWIWCSFNRHAQLRFCMKFEDAIRHATKMCD